ncbi:uncharacterized protein F4822DRAFT_107362 [Hypoxylon trugodes]|uniref:uncharacterized protein n=1 Tax=Hypoxylon trugodes TaxID=326681 RepID=UPI0021929740|nr:uncharacterized protein F4822DRAFT_107362 [Hypoxylon trugodes]KAI1391859.1 hypothetical protein F4822DRAFT_107362 [Hypoxylon trugodes]
MDSQEQIPTLPLQSPAKSLPSSQTIEHPPKSRASLPLGQSLGLAGAFSIIGGSLGALGVLSFLGIIWFGHGDASDGSQANRAWRYIAIRGWMTQAITLSAVLLRFIISIQTTICTSMIAALLLEKDGVRRSLAAWFSVTRSMNSGPRRLLGLIISSKNRTALRRVETWLVMIMVIITLALQFSSTILLSDMGKLEIISDTYNNKVHSIFESRDNKNEDIRETSGQFLIVQPIFPTFGEARSPLGAKPESNGLSDTGLMQRAFLPISEASDRTSIREFEGNVIVLNSQVACMRPKITAEYSSYSVLNGNSNGAIRGQLDYDLTFRSAQVKPKSLCGTQNCSRIPFSCWTAGAKFGWQSKSCLIDGLTTQFTKGTVAPEWNLSDGPWSPNSSVQLISTTNMQIRDWNKIRKWKPLPQANPYQEWNSHEILPGKFVNITLCFSAFKLERHYVNLTASGTLKEPPLIIPVGSSNYSSAGVQSLLGVSIPPGSHKDRGILNMEILGAPNDGPPSSPANSVSDFGAFGKLTLGESTTTSFMILLAFQFGEGLPRNTTITMCRFCGGTTNLVLNDKLSALMSDIIQQTGRAANAMLSLISTTWANLYYTYVDSMAILQHARMSRIMKVQAPGSCKKGCPGFITVATLLGIHLLYVTIITTLYFRQVRYSRQANIWHAISQLVSGDLKETLENANDASDEDVYKAEEKKDTDYLVRLERLEGSGRIEFVRV